MSKDSIKERYHDILDRLDRACKKAGRNRNDVKLLAVSKYHPIQAINELVEAGQTYFGENYIQEALEKRAQICSIRQNPNLCWDMIGHLQTRKAALAAGNFNLIHTLDSFKLARALEKRLTQINSKQDVLIEVNIGAEHQKAGVSPESARDLAIEVLTHTPDLRLRGLMCMPPFSAYGELARPYFVKLRQLRDALESAIGQKLPILSMGMSGDFDIAIEEGATIVRIGSAIFGPRPRK